MGSSKKIVSGVVWSTIVNIVNAVYGFIAVPILINHFGKAEYGLIGLAMSVNVYMNLMDKKELILLLQIVMIQLNL